MTDIEYLESKLFLDKWKIGVKRLEILPRLNLTEEGRNRISDRVRDWVFDKNRKIEDCPLKSDYWWQQ